MWFLNFEAILKFQNHILHENGLRNSKYNWREPVNSAVSKINWLFASKNKVFLCGKFAIDQAVSTSMFYIMRCSISGLKYYFFLEFDAFLYHDPYETFWKFSWIVLVIIDDALIETTLQNATEMC